MLPLEVAMLRDILLKMHVTNSESQAIRWASKIIEDLEKQGFGIERLPEEELRSR